jgi:hypothetical protein
MTMALQPGQKPSRRRGSAAEEMKLLIDQADADGVARKMMVLRMTLRDVSELKRDPKVAMEDINYKDGQMRYLGVPVAQGGVVSSTLDTSGAPVHIEVPAVVKPKRAAKPRVAKAPKDPNAPKKPRATKASKAAAEAEAATAE